jgi:pyruvate dehydrogenase E1 component alpha subunit
MTYRYRGHSMSDPGKYRSKEEVEKYRTERDPLGAIKKLLAVEGINEDDLKPMEKEIKDIVTEAAEFSQQSPEPDAGELWTDILVEV